ncbi:MAG: polysaccharide deacetylase family protein [candidate division Zixibacteria bacterium]|nr:polysaccharide deacetylase family protein [candidate division Zixibacteria bacterium]
MYHNLLRDADYTPDQWLAGGEPESVFKAHLKVLTDFCRVTSVEQAMVEIRSGGLKENTIAVTLDDGYLSAYEIAFPLFRKHSVSATVYLPTDWINGKMTMWWETFGDIVRSSDIGEIDRGKIDLILKKYDADPVFETGVVCKTKMEFNERVAFSLMKLSDSARWTAIEELKPVILGDSELIITRAVPCSWEQIREMSDAGIKFGAHTCSHLNLSHTSLDQAEREIAASKEEIEQRLGVTVTGFAYPYGYDPHGYVRFGSILDRLGFDYAVTSWWGLNFDQTDRFILHRDALPMETSLPLIKRGLYQIISQ